jgi:hypothetical protein
VGKPIDFDTCKLNQLTPPRPVFLVIGNSFSAAEFEMYSALAETGVGSVVATSSLGASPVSELRNQSKWAAANDYYWNTVIPRLRSRLQPGDMLLMINDLNNFTPGTVTSEDEERLALLGMALSRVADELKRNGVQIIFQTQNPLLREAYCTPDTAKVQWFKLEGATCNYYTKAYSLTRIRGLREVLNGVRSAHPNFHILDLFPVLCPKESCRLYDTQGVPLYRDGDSHMSVEANYLARPLLLTAVNDALRSSGQRPRNETASE